MYNALNKTKFPQAEMVSAYLAVATAVAGTLTQHASLLIDFYLQDKNSVYKVRIVKLAQKDDAESQKELEDYVFEGMRHAGFLPGSPLVATRDTTVHDGANGEVKIRAGQTAPVTTNKANLDPKAFPDPGKIIPGRGESTLLLDHGLHHCFGAKMVGAGLGATLKEVFKLKELKRAKGSLGRFSTVEHDIIGRSGGADGKVTMKLYLDANARESPIPMTLTLEYEE